jgi:hypothetical protein
MNLAYLIFLNEKILKPQELVFNLLNEITFNRKSNCLKLLPDIIEIIHRRNLDNSTLIIDLQQWILSILKTNTQEINFLFKYLNQSTCQLSLGMKQFLFDELINLSLKFKQQTKQNPDIWDRFDFIPIMIECVSNLENNYQIPYHPSILSNDHDLQTRPILLDLYFFHLRRQMSNENITLKLINKGMLLKPVKIENRNLKPFGENLFQQLKDYFRLKLIALLLCQSDWNEEEIQRMLSTIIIELLSIDQQQQPVKLSNYLQLFLSTIISKQSWNYLLNLFKRLNNPWAITLYDLLKLNQRQKQNIHLQLYHQIQFTLSSDNHASIFPKLHQPYEELRGIIDICVQSNTEENLLNWIQLKLYSNPIELQLNEIKSMLLLIIYYDYYCNNQLSSIDSLLKLIIDTLQLSFEELQVFRVLIRPKEFMIGYNQLNDHNLLNKLFQLECDDQFELTLRHMLVNLMAMILLGGKQSFLWTFVFEPLRLQNTFGKSLSLSFFLPI